MRLDAESFLQRWARRKRASQQPGPAAPHGPEDEGPAANPPEPSPRLEDLTANGNLAAFLQKGVPDALRNAALRRMWSLDPAIRDHVGLAECAWDFNRPESIPGFGSLARTFTPAFLSLGPAAGSAAPDAAPSSLRRPGFEAKSIVAARPPADEPGAASAQADATTDGEAALEPDVANPPALARRTAACRHGGALPRSRGAG